jgi:hypothetical protein
MRLVLLLTADWPRLLRLCSNADGCNGRLLHRRVLHCPAVNRMYVE